MNQDMCVWVGGCQSAVGKYLGRIFFPAEQAERKREKDENEGGKSNVASCQD